MDSAYHYFDHDADMGIVGEGDTIEQAFISGAQAVFAIMTDIKKVQAHKQVIIEFEEPDPELAFFTWLNHLIAKARENSMIFGQFELSKLNDHWHGHAWGEPWSEEMEHGTEVKGATMSMLEVKQLDHGWRVQCIVDV